MFTLPKQLSSEEISAQLSMVRPPMQHQSEEWAASQGALERLLWWEMGTGKTTAAIGFLRLKYRQYGRVGRTLVLAPLATLSGWKREFELNAPVAVSSRLVIASGMGKKKMPGKKRAAVILDDKHDIIVTNPESLNMPDVLDALCKKGFEYIVIDEIHGFKGYDSKRLKNLLKFSDKASVRIGLTGTLVLNSYQDVWGPARILDKGKRLGDSFFKFRRRYFQNLNEGWSGGFPNWVPAEGCAEDISRLLGEFTSRKKKEECLTLPPRVTMREEVELSAEQQKAYDEMETSLITEVQSGEATAANALVKILRMRQILSGFLSVHTDEDPGQADVRFSTNPRMDRLREILEQLAGQKKKVVVWSNFRANYPAFRKMAADLGVGYAELTGDTKDRQGEIERFQNDPNCMFFFSNPQAGGTGVDGLQHVASYCVYFDRSHNAAHYWQSRDRIHRRGSEVHDKVTELHLVAAGTLDDDILSALERKENFAEGVLERLRSKYGQGRPKG